MLPPLIRRSWDVLRDSVRLWSSKRAFQLAAALAFYTIFSLAPLLIIVIAVMGVVFGEAAVRGEIAIQIDQFIGSEAAVVVEDVIRGSRMEVAGILPTVFGVGALLFGATTVFAQLQTGLNAMWDVTSRPSRKGILVFLLARLASLGMVLVIGFLLLVSFLLTMLVSGLVRFAGHLIPVPAFVATGVDLGISLLILVVLFALIFKVLPDVRLAWRDVAPGAVLTGVLFVLGQYLISIYVTRAGPASTYGAAGSLVLVLMWVYYSSLILFFGAAFTRVRVERRGGTIAPASGSVKVKTEVVGGTADSGQAPGPAGPLVTRATPGSGPRKEVRPS
jgi:membrane protein